METDKSYLTLCFGKDVVELYTSLFGEDEYKNFNLRFCGFYSDEEEYTKYYYSTNYLLLQEFESVPTYEKFLQTEYKDGYHYDKKTKSLFKTSPVEQLEHPWNQSINFGL